MRISSVKTQAFGIYSGDQSQGNNQRPAELAYLYELQQEYHTDQDAGRVLLEPDWQLSNVQLASSMPSPS